jgi:hypothetical protein
VEPFLPARPSFGQHKPASEPRGFKLKDAILQASLILSAPVKSARPVQGWTSSAIESVKLPR